MEAREIEIRRTIVENALMAVKEYIKHHRKQVGYGAIGLLAGIVLVVAAVVYHDHRAGVELVRFEQVLEKYRTGFPSDDKERDAALEMTAKELDAIIGSSYWGYVHEFGYYIIGNLYFSEKRYKEAKEYFLKFADSSSGSVFAPMGLQQAARSCEYVDDLKGARQIYSRLEKDFEKSVVADQIPYDLGRICEQEGDLFKAREYYNKVITGFPRSQFAQKSRERIILLGLAERKDAR